MKTDIPEKLHKSISDWADNIEMGILELYEASDKNFPTKLKGPVLSTQTRIRNLIKKTKHTRF